jgi:DHA2 family multidrug resistance protein-like MFS transporter
LDSATEAPRAGRREWIGLAVIALPCLLYSMDLTVLNLALPRLSEILSPTGAQLLWIVDIYGFFVAGFLIPMGALGDRIGRRRLLLIGAATFGAGSVVAAFSRSAEMLIVTRAVLGLAGATLAPSTLSLIRNMFLDPRQRTVAIGVWTSSYSAGAAIGPLLGGLLLQRFWWGSVFLVSVPVMVLLLVLGPVLLPEFRDPRRWRIDVASAVLSLATVLPVIYGLKQIAQGDMGGVPIACLVAGPVVGWIFVRRQRTLERPLLDLELLRMGRVRAALGTLNLATMIAFGIFVFMAQYLQLGLGLSPLRAGLASLPWSIGFLIGSMSTPIVARRFPPARVMAVGFCAAALGFALLTQIGGGGSFAILIAASVVISLGMAPAFTLTTDITVGAAHPERAGAASALSETSSELGGALGVAVLGSVGLALYRSSIGDAIPALDGAVVSPELRGIARATFGGAVSVAQRLPQPLGDGLLHAARAAFTSAFRLTAAVCAAIALATAALVASRLGASTTVDDHHGSKQS